jgi:hypothetical protein
VAAIPLVGEDAIEGVADQRLHLGNHGCQRVTVIGIAGQRLHMGEMSTISPGSFATRSRSREAAVRQN